RRQYYSDLMKNAGIILFFCGLFMALAWFVLPKPVPPIADPLAQPPVHLDDVLVCASIVSMFLGIIIIYYVLSKSEDALNVARFDGRNLKFYNGFFQQAFVDLNREISNR